METTEMTAQLPTDEQTAFEQDIEQTAEVSADIVSDEHEELKAAYHEARVRLALLLLGVERDKLDEGARLTEGYCTAGLQPEEAAEQAVSAYPHLCVMKRSIPKLSEQGGGKGDGFAAIRSIFAKR